MLWSTYITISAAPSSFNILPSKIQMLERCSIEINCKMKFVWMYLIYNSFFFLFGTKIAMEKMFWLLIFCWFLLINYESFKTQSPIIRANIFLWLLDRMLSYIFLLLPLPLLHLHLYDMDSSHIIHDGDIVLHCKPCRRSLLHF